jgi:GT2 family glycosyltransferase
MAVLEALAAGRPAVVPDAAGPAEIVDSTCGRRYRPGDAGAAARALLEVLDAPGLGAGGPARVREHFDLEASRRRYGAALAPLRRRAGRAGRAAELTVVTVTRNSARELRGLLASAARELPGARVVVVDCDSSDESVAVAETFASARVIALAENAGFARACNLGVAAVDAGAVALVNPDVELVDGSLGWLAAEALREDPGAPERLLAPLVLLGDGSRQDSVHPRPVSSADLLRSLVPPALLPPPLRERCEPWRARAPRRVGWAVGCALVARADTLRRLGPFEERLFLYGEDLELGVRAARAGVETWFWPGARVIHHRAHSSAREFGGEPFEALAQARHDAVRLALGPRRARVDDGAQALTFRSRAALKRALGRDAERERRQLEALHRVR